MHYGSRSCHKKRLFEDIARIAADPNAFWFGGGDYADYIAPGDKRFSAGEIDPDLSVADVADLGSVMVEHLYDFFQPIKHKCLGLLLGNHETKYIGVNNQGSLHAGFCLKMGQPNLGYSALIDLCFRRTAKLKRPRLLPAQKTPDNEETSTHYTVRFALHHGFGGAITPGGKLNSLIKFQNSIEADVHMMGHVHDQKAQRTVRIGADRLCENLCHKESIGVITGAYLMTYKQGSTSYGEQKGYSPCPLGAVRILIKPDKKEIKGEV